MQWLVTSQKTGKDVSELPYSVLTSEQLKKNSDRLLSLQQQTATTAVVLHGLLTVLDRRQLFICPRELLSPVFQNIAKEGAQVDIQELNYDDCVRLAAKEADETPRGVIVQDTAWDGYEEIPAWIMRGYGTMAMEVGEQLKAQGCERPTHIFVQAGVGSLAGAVVGYFSNLYADNLPTFVVVEAEAAACLYKGAAAGDGDIRIVDGDMQTIMAGLACGEPNTISWDILKNHVKVFIAAPDWVAANGMRMLAAPVKGDVRSLPVSPVLLHSVH